MSCPDWSRLAPPGEGETDAASERSWREATEHLRHCRRCATAAQERDPLLLFQRLPRVEVGDRDISEMQQRVAGARKVLVASAEPVRSQRPRAGLLAAAVVLALGLTWVASDLDLQPPTPTRAVATSAADPATSATDPAASATDPAASATDPEGLEEARRKASKHVAMLPLVEGVGRISHQVQGPTFDWLELSFESE